MSNYSKTLNEIKEKLKLYLDTIYQVSGDELLLELEHYNLLTNKNNCIETSTATGFLMEEYITSKLEIFTKKYNNKEDEIVIHKLDENISTANSSYDCYGFYKGIKVLINIKVEKETSKNNAIAAINILYNDYIKEDIEKCYIILKTHYGFDNSKKDNERKIMINGTSCYALEEIDFSKGHKQDHRNWSERFNMNSGRLQITENWMKDNLLNPDEISYEKTKKFLFEIYDGRSREI